jgi:hypothetical protein
MTPERPFDPGDRYRDAARAYFVYGIVYWLGGLWLELHGVGTRGSGSMLATGVSYLVAGLVFLFGVPYVLRRPRPWFERWVLGRRDFARILTVFMAVRAWFVLRVALRPETASVPAPWGGEISFRTGAAVFFIVTVVATLFVAVAAWTTDQKVPE